MGVLESHGEVRRLAEIARVAAAKGWGRYAAKLGLGAGTEAPASASLASDAQRLREAFEELGPTFVKLGQMMAARADLFPEALVGELGRLHERAAPFPGERARSIIEAETRRPLGELYARFDDTPIAAASIAQVHRAALHDGREVIVKVQRPDIDATIEGDISLLRRLARVLVTVVPATQPFALPELVEELAQTLRDELDFEREGGSCERFAEANADDEVLVPAVFWQATTRRVLTLEHCPGQRLDAFAADPAQNRALASRVMRLFLRQVFERGVFHGDPHPGNVFLLDDGRVCFHDFGAVGEISPNVQERLRELFFAVVARDAGWVASAYLGMGGASAEIDRAAFARDLGHSLERYYAESSHGRRSFSAILQEFVRLGRAYRIRLLPDTALLLRAFAELEGLVRGLDPHFSPLEALRSYSGALFRHAFTPTLGAARAAQAYRIASAAREVARDAPVALHRLIGRLERGEALFDIRHQSGGSLERHLLHASNRLAFALIIASLVVGSAIILAADAGPGFAGFPVLGIVGFVVSAVLGASWAVIALRSGKL